MKEYPSAGLLETNSIALGIEACDAMLKRAEVTLIDAHPICPGKYLTVIMGEVGAVETAIREGVEKAGTTAVERIVIPNLHPEVFPAMAGSVEIDELGALGVMETFSAASAIISADASVKAAEVRLIDIRLATGLGGKGYYILTGDVGPVRDAIEAGAARAAEDGMLHSNVVIPGPHPGIRRSIF